MNTNPLEHLLSQAMSAELYLSHFASREDHEDYNQSMMAFVASWCQLKLARSPEEFIPRLSPLV